MKLFKHKKQCNGMQLQILTNICQSLLIEQKNSKAMRQKGDTTSLSDMYKRQLDRLTLLCKFMNFDYIITEVNISITTELTKQKVLYVSLWQFDHSAVAEKEIPKNEKK